jgi:cytochrome oxidase Cu insertion factor (SCO1/SenC/PrrC family)
VRVRGIFALRARLTARSDRGSFPSGVSMSVPFSRRRALLAVTLAAGALALTSCSTSSGQSTTSPPASSARPSASQPTPSNGTTLDQPVPAAVSTIKFQNQDGQAVSLDSLKGKTVVFTDFLTLCQEICPLTSANYASLQSTLDKAGMSSDVELVELTVDPARDSVARLAAYQKLFGAKPNWEFLTGTPAQVAAIWQALGVSYDTTIDKPPLPRDWWTGKPLTYDVDHQDVVFVIDAQGHERWLVEASPNTQGVTPPSTLLKFLNDDGQNNLAKPEDPNWTAGDVAQAVAWVTGKPVS